MRAVGIVVIVAGLLLTAAGCRSRSSAPQAEQSKSANGPMSHVEPFHPSADLPDLARALIPEEADAVTEDELAVEECGIAPTFPCVQAYFVIENLDLDARLGLMRRQARSAGWRILSERHDARRILSKRRDASVTIEIRRESFGATYMMEGDDPIFCRAASRCSAGTMLTVFGPPTPLPAPSEAERAAWSAQKRTYVLDANAVCTTMLARAAGRPQAFVDALTHGLENLAALDVPAREERQVENFLRPLRNLVRAARALTDGRGEDALPAAVAVAEFAKRFNRAAARYGLEGCATVG